MLQGYGLHLANKTEKRGENDGFAAEPCCPDVLPCARSDPAQARRNTIPASDTEIKIGNIMPYSGPHQPMDDRQGAGAYFNKINAEGGINGRKINFISYDDASVRQGGRAGAKLVESDECC